jgi:hypothetical protein
MLEETRAILRYVAEELGTDTPDVRFWAGVPHIEWSLAAVQRHDAAHRR